MGSKEAQARIKVNKLLEEAGWRFFQTAEGRANIKCEYLTRFNIGIQDVGNNFEKIKNGFLDYLLLNENGFPVALVEAKKTGIDPLDAKDQARKYAESQGVRYIFLTNGERHYYWDLLHGNPLPIRRFLTLGQMGEASKWEPDPKSMAKIEIEENYIAYSQDARWSGYSNKDRELVKKNKNIKLLRDYQIAAAQAIQHDYINGKNRFLFEMATGTGKTLLSAAIVKLFLSTGNAERVLFLVDRLELETQAKEAFDKYFKEDNYRSVIYKENRSSWENAKVVITTIQSLTFNNHYRTEFIPSDFQLIISDEAHRTISGNNRNIFEYFIGSKLGLTATPRNYLKGIDIKKMRENKTLELEHRLMQDTYTTFGCENGEPTFRFDLQKAVKHIPPYLVNPYVLDVRTDITTELLSKEGWASIITGNEDEEENEENQDINKTIKAEEDTEAKPERYYKRDFERKFFSQATNEAFISTFLKHAKRDPLTGEIGKTILFAVKRTHAAKLVKMLNEKIEQLYPGTYNSDFAKQVTSNIPNAQECTSDFKTDRNCLSGNSRFTDKFEDYKTSKTRVCVTVGMMTTGYDCEDLMNVVLCRPIFSPTDFVQIKGRGTRLYRFEHPGTSKHHDKDNFYLFDFFANCEYFEKDFNYDQKIELPKKSSSKGELGDPPAPYFEFDGPDEIKNIDQEQIGDDCMKIDREMFKPVKVDLDIREQVQNSPEAQKILQDDNMPGLAKFVSDNILDKPAEFWNMDKISQEHKLKRKLDIIEYLQVLFGKRPRFKTNDEVIDSFFERFYQSDKADTAKMYELRSLFFAYILNPDIRRIIDNKEYPSLEVQSGLSLNDLEKLGKKQIKDTISFIKNNQIIQNFNQSA